MKPIVHARQLFDPRFRRVEEREAPTVQRVASSPELDCVVEADVTSLEAGDDLAQLALRLLERELVGHGFVTSSTVAAREPLASSMSIVSPMSTTVASPSTTPCERTMA